MTSPILELRSLRAGYNDSIVVDDVNLSIGQGEVVCLLGANGAGKTTIMRAVTGLIPAFAGSIHCNGDNITTMPSHDRVAAGICLSPEGRQIFPDLTVMENLTLGSYNKRSRPNRQKNIERVLDLFPRLGERKSQAAGSMSGGEQQMLAIGRALMGEPKVLALDEPSLGLAPKLVLTVLDSIRAVARSGITILLVEQNTRAALSVAQRGYVLSAGHIVHEGPADQLAQSEMVQKAFLGSTYSKDSKRTTRRERRMLAAAGKVPDHA